MSSIRRRVLLTAFQNAGKLCSAEMGREGRKGRGGKQEGKAIRGEHGWERLEGKTRKRSKGKRGERAEGCSLFVGKLSVGDVRNGVAVTNTAQNRPFSAITRNSVTGTRRSSLSANTTVGRNGGVYFKDFLDPTTLPPLALEVGPLKSSWGSGERCKLPQRGNFGFRCILALKSDIWWQQFQ